MAVTKLAKSEIGNMIFEQKREETKSVVCSKTQKTLGFPGLWVVTEFNVAALVRWSLLVSQGVSVTAFGFTLEPCGSSMITFFRAV